MKPDFVYHAPTPATAPRYAAIRDAERACRDYIAGTDGKDRPAAFAAINAACRNFATVIEAVAPKCADTTTAVRCVRLARMEANEAVATGAADGWRAMSDALRQARMWACAAVALAEEGDLP
jgi:hypothetical protein